VALIRPRKPYIYNSAQLQPAQFYSRPALPPYYQGLNGFGQARSTANKQFEYTLKQMAVSPFSVNSKSYMDRIREQYGYEDNGMYDAFGMIGGVVGAGVGSLFGAGLLDLRSPFKSWNVGPNSWNVEAFIMEALDTS